MCQAYHLGPLSPTDLPGQALQREAPTGNRGCGLSTRAAQEPRAPTVSWQAESCKTRPHPAKPTGHSTFLEQPFSAPRSMSLVGSDLWGPGLGLEQGEGSGVSLSSPEPS